MVYLTDKDTANLDECFEVGMEFLGNQEKWRK
jgi:hypothetical protein